MSLAPVTVVHTECSRGWGGQEIRIHSEMLAMRARGHRVLLAAPADSRIHEKSVQSGIAVVTFSDAKLYYPASIFRLAALFRRTSALVVNPHSSRDGWIASIAARLAGTPCIVRSRHIEVDYPNRLISRVAFHHLPHHVLTTSRRISERLIAELGLMPSRVTSVPTGIDLTRFHPGAQPAMFSAGTGANRGFLVGMIAVLRSWKGHDDFLDAAKLVRDSGINARFMIAGDGPGKDRLLQGIAARGLEGIAIWLGHREDVPNLLAALDVVVLPSYAHEGIPQILMQAQAAGKPVIGTDVGGIPEVIRHEETGLLVPARNPSALAAAISRLSVEQSMRRALGAAAAQHASKFYGLDLMCERLESIYSRYLPT